MEAAALLARALDPAAPPPTDATSQRILDGALDAAAASGVKHVTIDEVARRAGVGRVTVYRKFGDRQRLVEALGVREAKRCIALLDEATTPDQPIDVQVAEGFVAGLRMLREHPLLSRLVTHEPDVLLDSLTNPRAALFPLARAYVAGRLAASREAGAGPRTDVDLLQVAEAFLRITISFALIPDTVLPLDDEDAARETARRLIAPIVRG
ncbi:MAG TPA: TetR/AcrR family transcriptional regulator [Solirubrobacterales bacterium]|nr:TetR/AcrR family transcriptional regulator [Solirubrobacterales bacterium]